MMKNSNITVGMEMDIPLLNAFGSPEMVWTAQLSVSIKNLKITLNRLPIQGTLTKNNSMRPIGSINVETNETTGLANKKQFGN